MSINQDHFWIQGTSSLSQQNTMCCSVSHPSCHFFFFYVQSSEILCLRFRYSEDFLNSLGVVNNQGEVEAEWKTEGSDRRFSQGQETACF